MWTRGCQSPARPAGVRQSLSIGRRPPRRGLPAHPHGLTHPVVAAMPRHGPQRARAAKRVLSSPRRQPDAVDAPAAAGRSAAGAGPLPRAFGDGHRHRRRPRVLRARPVCGVVPRPVRRSAVRDPPERVAGTCLTTEWRAIMLARLNERAPQNPADVLAWPRPHTSFQQHVTDLATRLATVRPDALDAAIVDGLHEIADALRLDAALLWQKPGDDVIVSHQLDSSAGVLAGADAAALASPGDVPARRGNAGVVFDGGRPVRRTRGWPAGGFRSAAIVPAGARNRPARNGGADRRLADDGGGVDASRAGPAASRRRGLQPGAGAARRASRRCSARSR